MADRGTRFEDFSGLLRLRGDANHPGSVQIFFSEFYVSVALLQSADGHCVFTFSQFFSTSEAARLSLVYVWKVVLMTLYLSYLTMVSLARLLILEQDSTKNASKLQLFKEDRYLIFSESPLLAYSPYFPAKAMKVYP